jgi:PleD family two-component response regulator
MGAQLEGGKRPAIILVASDEEWASRSIDSVLVAQGYAVLRSRSGTALVNAVRAAAPDAIILDSAAREMDPHDLLRQVTSQLGPATPVLVFSTHPVSRPDRLQALAAGAWAILSHPIDGEGLVLQLRTFLAAKEDSDTAKGINLIDNPTGLYSALGLAKRAREIGAEAMRRRQPLACVAVAPLLDDVEPGGDVSETQVAAHLAAVLLQIGRVSDAIGRFGEREFGVVAPATDSVGAEKMVARLRNVLGSNPIRCNGRDVPIHIGVGCKAVSNFAESPIDALEMLVRASVSLRATLSATVGDPASGLSAPRSTLPS